MQPRTEERDFREHVLQSCELAGLRLAERVYAAKTRVPSHAHPQAVFCIGLTGTCSEVFAGKSRRYEASTVSFLPAHQCHSLDFPLADTRAFSIEVGDRWIESAREASLRLDDSVHADGGSLSGLMMRVYGELRHQDSASPVAIQGLVMEMLAAVSRKSSNRSDRPPQHWLVRAEEFLRESFTERSTLAQVASVVGLHPVHLAREFRRVHGCTIGEYIRRLRVERACRRLSSSDESLAAIGAGAGFADQSHFSRTFKRLMGMTPTQYRASFDRH